jgi:glucose-1-phosphate thymidylyltransferase
MKGIILAGGEGTRLYPSTRSLSKQLIPVYDKPMIFYPLSTLMMAGIRDILIISTPSDLPTFKKLFGDGHDLGINLQYVEQLKPDGIASAFILGEEFIGNDSVALILGDNIFYGYDFKNILKNNKRLPKQGARIFAYEVSDPQRFGVVSFNRSGKVTSIVEKPTRPKSNYAVVGLYFYDNNVCRIAKSMKPSKRGELEITDINKFYMEKNQLNVTTLSSGFAWLDTGTHNSLLEAGQFVSTIEKRQGIKIGCIEEVAYRNGWISKKDLRKIIEKNYFKASYGEYLENVTKKG